MENEKPRGSPGLAMLFAGLGLNEVYGMKHWPAFTLSRYLGIYMFPLVAFLVLGYCFLCWQRGYIAMAHWGTVEWEKRPRAFAFIFGMWLALGLFTLTVFFFILMVKKP